MSSSFGTLFKIATFGESHCPAVGVVVDGCPPGMELRREDIQVQLDRRRPGQSKLSTDRSEADQVKILSGVEFDRTLGTPIGMLVPNLDQRPGDYGETLQVPRPSHADYTYQMKYGIRAASGGGRASARETIGRVAAGAIAEKYLRETHGIEIVAWVSAVGAVEAPAADPFLLTRSQVDANPVRCPDAATAAAMEEEIVAVRAAQDSIGGVVSCVCRHVPAGLGEPVFGKLEALLAQSMLSLPASKGFEFGSGFAGTRLRGSQHNDPFVVRSGGRLGTLTNHSGGVQGGISNGEPISFRVAFKPVATIGLAQQTVDLDGNEVTLEAKGRHDPCVVPRAVPIVEAMAALTLIDLLLIQRARAGHF
ncbi:chorismate synthase [Desulfuromonas carbonis]|uniref:chorismate synthase n=1 Tax=Desulfuromonas sp. DDH964 TaxID=1823759 RepID=UPI00078E4297|nr:chorismate synthase [Desulfuromonas sp. DDH964]AMV73301.1 chorismate synthase [Desulfuromonas sp. DDH964]